MKNSPLIPTYRPATEAENITFQAVVKDQMVLELSCLQAIETRAEQRAGGAWAASDKQMLEEDVADFENIDDSSLQRFAADQILDNILQYPSYQIEFVELGKQLPELKTKLTALNNETVRRNIAKEDRKTMDMAISTGIAGSELANARIDHASTQNTHEYCGPVVAVNDYFALQKTSRDGFTLHCLSDLNQLPIKDHQLLIKYGNGIGVVVDESLQRAQGLAHGTAR
jgi:hypothetical protein